MDQPWPASGGGDGERRLAPGEWLNRPHPATDDPDAARPAATGWRLERGLLTLVHAADDGTSQPVLLLPGDCLGEEQVLGLPRRLQVQAFTACVLSALPPPSDQNDQLQRQRALLDQWAARASLLPALRTGRMPLRTARLLALLAKPGVDAGGPAALSAGRAPRGCDAAMLLDTTPETISRLMGRARLRPATGCTEEAQ